MVLVADDGSLCTEIEVILIACILKMFVAIAERNLVINIEAERIAELEARLTLDRVNEPQTEFFDVPRDRK